MLLPKFDFYEPTKLPEACEIMDDLKDKGHPLAGGTDLLVNMKKKLIAPGPRFPCKDRRIKGDRCLQWHLENRCLCHGS